MTADGYYKTGDILRRDADGFAYFVDRVDDMFVCNGENVFPVEVEKLLESHPAIKQACVVPVDDEVHGAMPVAFVVAADGMALDTDTVKQHALAKTSSPSLYEIFGQSLSPARTNSIERPRCRRDQTPGRVETKMAGHSIYIDCAPNMRDLMATYPSEPTRGRPAYGR